ncbi:MAG: hypothetical protein R3190_05595, partial [Thermoanaerobaculia bacterium]|nr:hypothetical protein [Thermoanaerobaculia bacterium]
MKIHLGRSLWRYVVRYLPWVLIAVVSMVTYAATTAAMISLIEPLFSEVLPFGESEVSLPIPGGEAAAGEDGEALGVLDLRGRLDAIYEGLKRRFGVTPDTVVFFVPILFFLV